MKLTARHRKIWKRTWGQPETKTNALNVVKISLSRYPNSSIILPPRSNLYSVVLPKSDTSVKFVGSLRSSQSLEHWMIQKNFYPKILDKDSYVLSDWRDGEVLPTSMLHLPKSGTSWQSSCQPKKWFKQTNWCKLKVRHDEYDGLSMFFGICINDQKARDVLSTRMSMSHHSRADDSFWIMNSKIHKRAVKKDAKIRTTIW